jgi:hypothetical protein
MTTIFTLERRKEFEYNGNTLSGVTLHFSSGNVRIPGKLFKDILEKFDGKTIPGGFCMTSPTRGGLGEWVKQNSSLSPKHCSHIAAILVHEGLIRSRLQGKSVFLDF